ncbi:LOW QUALITY PROTEIN: EF-hand calcium-binding domain-containing protein 6 [Phoenicopterus ruber ruber]
MRTAAPLPNQTRRPLLLRQQRPGNRRASTRRRTVPAPAGSAPPPRAAVTPVSSVPDPTLFSWDMGQTLLQKTAEKEDELKKAFQMLDVGQTLTVSKGEFRRVIGTFLFHVTEAEFSAALAGIAKNVKTIIRCCRLFDHSHAGWIQRHTLRQILEITCFRMKDSEFEKLWNHYCVRNSNVMDYKEFLRNFGITCKAADFAKSVFLTALTCQKIKEKEQKQKKLFLHSSPAKLSLQSLPAERAVTECSLDSTERAFREKLYSAYQDIEKAFRAIDVSRSGFVSLDYLKSVINGFIFPLPNETFQELMNRFGLKATGKIAWQQFLEEFWDPGTTFENRQTIPMRKKHKVNPARGEEAFSSDTVLQKLCRYIQDVYPSLKKAFLMLDEAMVGVHGNSNLESTWLNRVKFAQIQQLFSQIQLRVNIDSRAVFQMKDKDFQELIEIVDLEQTGYLDYHEFLDLFEEKESVVKEILSDKITENWKDFHKALQSYDPKCTGTISRSHLRKVLQLCCPSLSDQQFMKLCYKYKDNSSDGIFYKMLLDNLKVAVLSGDLNGISSHVSKEKQQREEKRQTELSKRIKQIEDQANKYAQNRTVDEVIKRLKDRVIQQAATIKDSFFAYNKPHGKINKSGSRKVLEDHGMPMDDSQFNLLTEKLGLPDGGFYLDFVAILEDVRLNGLGATLCNSPNHRVNDAKYHCMTAGECLSQLNDKRMEVYGDTYSAFRETDSNHDGTTNMLNFQQVLYSCLRDEEFLRLFGLLGMNPASTLNYQEFCQLFRTQETKEVPPWLVPSHKKKQMIRDAELACDHAHYYLVIKARTRWHDLARNFQEFDSEGNAIIQPRDLKKVLFIGIPITPEEFKQLWARYDTDAKGYLTRQEFLQKLGIEFASADTGLSRHIMEDSYGRLQAHYNSQQKKRSKLEEQQKQQTKTLHVREIKKQVKDKFRDYFQDFNKAFHKVDKNRDGYVTACDLQEFNYYLDHDQFSSLLNSLGIGIHDSELSYFDFLRAIDDGRASKYRQGQKQAAPPASFAALSLEQTPIKIKEIVASSYDLLYKAFSRFDKEDTGVIKALEFQVLDHFCFKLSDNHFRHLLKNFNLCEDFTVDWKVFLKKINHFIETEEGQKVIPPKSSWELSERGILSQIQEVVTAGFNAVAQEFKDTDSSNDNTVSKEEFWDICKRHFQRLTEEQVSASSRPQTTTCSTPVFNCETIENKIRKNIQHSWRDILKVCKEKDVSKLGEIPVSDFLDIAEKFNLDLSEGEINQITTKYDLKKNGRFAYYDFLQSCVLLLKPRESSLLHRVIIQKPQKPLSPGPQTTSFFSAMLRIQPQILHCWRPMKRTFKAYDESHTGLLHIADFRQVLHEYSIDLTEEELFNILEYYDKNLSSKISYNDFLCAFIQ